MTHDKFLAAHLTPPGTGAGFEARRDGDLALIEPLTVIAEAWLRAHVDEEATWLGGTLVVEMPYFPDIADAIIAAGFKFERDAHLN